MDKDSKILSKNSKNSEYSITFGGIAKFKPYKTDFLSYNSEKLNVTLSESYPYF